MHKRIMVPIDGSEKGRTALAVAVRLARRSGAEIHLVEVEATLVPWVGITRMDAYTDGQDRADARREIRQKKLGALGDECRAWGLTVSTATEEGEVPPTLTGYAERNDVDLIIMSSHDRGRVGRLALGSVTDFVIRNTHVPVIVVKTPMTFIPGEAEDRFARILVPMDGSDLATQILPQVEALAEHLKATISLLQVVTPFSYSLREIRDPAMPWWETDTGSGETYLSGIAASLTKKGLTVEHEAVFGDNVADTIIRYAHKARTDLIAIATSGSGGFRRLVLGGVADEVTRNSDMSVLVFHPRETEVGAADPVDAFQAVV